MWGSLSAIETRLLVLGQPGRDAPAAAELNGGDDGRAWSPGPVGLRFRPRSRLDNGIDECLGDLPAACPAIEPDD